MNKLERWWMIIVVTMVVTVIILGLLQILNIVNDNEITLVYVNFIFGLVVLSIPINAVMMYLSIKSRK